MCVGEFQETRGIAIECATPHYVSTASATLAQCAITHAVRIHNSTRDFGSIHYERNNNKMMNCDCLCNTFTVLTIDRIILECPTCLRLWGKDDSCFASINLDQL